jgi:Uma2 family endonuclease
MTVSLNRYRFSVEQFVRIEQHEVLGPAGNIELLDGLIYDAQPEQPELVDRVARSLAASFGDAVLARSPLQLPPHSALVPDVTVRAQDSALLVIEVADASLALDQGVKLPIYAREYVPEVWIVDVRADVVHVHTDPDGCSYRVVRTLTRDEVVAPAAFDDVRIPVADLF